MTNAPLTAEPLRRSVADARKRLLKHELLHADVTQGFALSYPVPRRSGAGLVLAHFLYGAPIVAASSDRLLSRPRYWLLTAPRDARVLFFADCMVEDFTPEGYADATWPRPEPPAPSIPELQAMEQQVLESLAAFLDGCFVESASLSGEARAGLTTYVEVLGRLTPQPLMPFVHAISPEFWEWAEAAGVQLA